MNYQFFVHFSNFTQEGPFPTFLKAVDVGLELFKDPIDSKEKHIIENFNYVDDKGRHRIYEVSSRARGFYITREELDT